MGKIIIAPNKESYEGPIIFLGGPIQGASDWQSEAIGLLSINSDVNIASPRRVSETRGSFSDEEYNRQVEWEHEYLYRAGKNGVVMFWFPRPSVDVSGRAYAQTSRFELGETLALSYTSGIKVVVGIEKGFSNERFIRKSFRDKAPSIPILSTLEEACETALEVIRTP